MQHWLQNIYRNKKVQDVHNLMYSYIFSVLVRMKNKCNRIKSKMGLKFFIVKNIYRLK